MTTMIRPRRVAATCILNLVVLLLTACATGQSPAPAVSAGPQFVCTTERPIGSHMPQRTCRSRAQVDAERTAARGTMEAIRNAPSVPPDDH